MLRLCAYIRPHRAEEVRTALANIGIAGLSVNEARGRGNHPERPTAFGASEYVIALPVRSRIEIVVHDHQLEEAIAAISQAASTGEPGDGKIFVERIEDTIRIRTKERGPDAL